MEGIRNGNRSLALVMMKVTTDYSCDFCALWLEITDKYVPVIVGHFVELLSVNLSAFVTFCQRLV